MRVLIVLREFYSSSRPIGGAERQAFKLATCFIEKGLNVRVVSGKWDWGQPSRDQINSIPVDRHFTAWGMFDIRGLRRISPYLYLLSLFIYLIHHRKDYDIVHCHSALFGAFAVTTAGRLLNKKTIVRSMASGTWGDVQRVQKGTTIWGARWMQRKAVDADCFVALNSQIEAELVALGVPLQRIVQIPNGVITSGKNPKHTYAIGEIVTVLFVGRLHPQKGVDVLIHALNKAALMVPELSWRLLIAGSGYLKKDLEILSEQMQLYVKVDFLGEVAAPDILYAGADIFVLPSRSEGMSNALLEAMAQGAPSIVSDIPGNNDLISDQESGLLFQMDNIEELAEKIICLVQDLDLRKRIGQAAFQSGVDNFSINSVADRYIELYSHLLTNEGQTLIDG